MKVKRESRSYLSPARAEAARATRAAILAAARQLFLTQGYVGTPLTAVASRAGVAVDTIYETIGRKRELFRLLIETAISGEDRPVASEDREYVKQIRAA